MWSDTFAIGYEVVGLLVVAILEFSGLCSLHFYTQRGFLHYLHTSLLSPVLPSCLYSSPLSSLILPLLTRLPILLFPLTFLFSPPLFPLCSLLFPRPPLIPTLTQSIHRTPDPYPFRFLRSAFRKGGTWAGNASKGWGGKGRREG